MKEAILNSIRMNHGTERSVTALRPHTRNARTHSKRQIEQIAESIKRFGFTNPVLVDAEDRIIAGHGRVAAAKESLPIIVSPNLPAGTMICCGWSLATYWHSIRTSIWRSPALKVRRWKGCSM